MAAGKTLRVETLAPAQVHWSADGWLTSEDNEIRETCLGVYMADPKLAAWPLERKLTSPSTGPWRHAGKGLISP